MIRLIELFAGVGSQAMALRNIGVEFEHHKVVEFDKFAIKSYNAIHNTNFEVSDITEINGSDLDITDTDKYEYLMTYSFPCQDLSLAGNQKGMDKGSNTRSGLLWEVERLLNETTELPQTLLMENVTQVHNKKNLDNFNMWCDFLESKGYTNTFKDMNAKNYGIPQSRNRTFMISTLENKTYIFPEPFELKTTLNDLLEDTVDEKFYLSEKQCLRLKTTTYVSNKRRVQKKDWCDTLCARDYKDPKCVVEERRDEGLRTFKDGCVGSLRTSNSCGDKRGIEPKCTEVVRLGGMYDNEKSKHQAGSVYDKNGLAPTLSTMQGGNLQPMIVASRGRNLENSSDRTTENKVVQILEPNSQGMCNTITTVQKDNYVLIPQATKKGYIECEIDGVADLSYPTSTTRRGRVQEKGSISPTITATETGVCKIENSFRIRKLTPKECWRLMGFSDSDFEKAEEVNSNSQLYKQAGNSIVVNVLELILKKLY